MVEDKHKNLFFMANYKKFRVCLMSVHDEEVLDFIHEHRSEWRQRNGEIICSKRAISLHVNYVMRLDIVNHTICLFID